jgi:hypothetical protein
MADGHLWRRLSFLRTGFFFRDTQSWLGMACFGHVASWSQWHVSFFVTLRHRVAIGREAVDWGQRLCLGRGRTCWNTHPGSPLALRPASYRLLCLLHTAVNLPSGKHRSLQAWGRDLAPRSGPESSSRPSDRELTPCLGPGASPARGRELNPGLGP